MTGSPPVGVTGGVGGIEARADDLAALAGCLARAGTDLAEVGVEVGFAGLALLDPAPTLLDPVGAAAAAAALGRALHGPAGLTSLTAGTFALAARVRAAATAYDLDAVVTAEFTGALQGLAGAPRALVVGVRVGLDTGSAARGLQAGLALDPHLVDTAVLAVGGGDPSGVARVLADAFPDGRAVVTPSTGHAGLDPAGPPRDVAGLVAALDRRNEDVPGAVDVRVLTTVDPDGTVHRRAVVDIPGTKDWSLQGRNPDVTGLGSNLRALSGTDSTYADGVLAALAAAGVEPGTEVLFVGHSLGGMVALAAAGRAQAGGYRVGGVVTVGSPLGAIPPPAGVPVLAVENRRDVVPHLDGAVNPAGPDVVTVTVDHPTLTTGDNHGLDSAYRAGAVDVDASTDPSVVAARARLTPFLTADTVETRVFVVQRSYQ